MIVVYANDLSRKKGHKKKNRTKIRSQIKMHIPKTPNTGSKQNHPDFSQTSESPEPPVPM